MSEEELIEELSSLFNDIENDERYTDTIYRNITNLQQENKQLKEDKKKAREYIKYNLKSFIYSKEYKDLMETLGGKE